MLRFNRPVMNGLPVIGDESRLRGLFYFMESMKVKKVAILVDGGFYRKVAYRLWGDKSPEERVNELIKYCHFHLKDRDCYTWQNGKKVHQYNELYRIFYYDCEPVKKTIYNPVTQKNFDFSKTPVYTWMNTFLNSLKVRRKVALRLGFFADDEMNYIFSSDTVRKLCKKSITIDDITEKNLVLNMRQKGVDMKIGLDIATFAYKHLVDQIVLISGDSDFVPAAKLARVEGIDFILDSLGTHINENLTEHIDGLRSYYKSFFNSNDDEKMETLQ